MSLTLLSFLLVAQGASRLPSLARTFAVGDKDAFLMLPPETVAGANARQLVWTSDGSHLAVLRMAFEGNALDVARSSLGVPLTSNVLATLGFSQEIAVWSAETHKVRTVVSLKSTATILQELRPIAGTDRLLFEATEEAADGKPEHAVESLSIMATGTGSVMRLTTLERSAMGAYDRVVLAPTRPRGLIQREGEEGSVVRFFGADGKIGDWLRLPFADRLQFDSSGRVGYVVVMGPKGKRVAKFQTIDSSTGKAAALIDDLPTADDDDETPVAALAGSSAPLRAAPRESPLLAAYATNVVAPPGLKVPAVVLSVRGGKPEETGVVTTDGSEPLLSPRLDAVAYVVQGSAMVRPLVRLPRSAFENARDDALRAVALSNAKQSVLGLLMYAGDNDDALPSATGDLWGTIGPYVKSRDIVDAFHYTFGGGLQTGIKDPASTQLGYVEGPGGRAIAYADGHAKWVPNP